MAGVPSDPLKCSQFRAACRLRLECISNGSCDPSTDAMRAADLLLVKVPEHTWGDTTNCLWASSILYFGVCVGLIEICDADIKLFLFLIYYCPRYQRSA